MTHSAAVHSIRKRQRNVVMRLSPISIACASVLIASGSVYAQDAQATDGSLCLLYTSPSPRDGLLSRMPSSA